MSAKRGRSGSKSYYKPPSALDKIRYRLADGDPIYTLLRYFHGRSKLPKDVRAIAETAEKLHEIGQLIQEIHDSGGVIEVDKVTGSNSEELKRLLNGDAAEMISTFQKRARAALVEKTMKEPSGE